jgi:hypothetical protein
MSMGMAAAVLVPAAVYPKIKASSPRRLLSPCVAGRRLRRDSEKVDRLSDLGVTKLWTTCPFRCIAKKQETKKLHN